jgi:glycerol-3-phosphate dehydrogenase
LRTTESPVAKAAGPFCCGVWPLRSDRGKKYVLTAGMVLIVPPNVPLELVCTEDSMDMDFFAPQRQDWMDGVPSVPATKK